MLTSLNVTTLTFLANLRRSVHVPDPGVGHGDLEVGVAGLGADLEVDGVAEVEAPVGLDDVLEDAHHVAVLAVEMELHLGLVLLQVLGAHRVTPPLRSVAVSCLIAGQLVGRRRTTSSTEHPRAGPADVDEALPVLGARAVLIERLLVLLGHVALVQREVVLRDSRRASRS